MLKQNNNPNPYTFREKIYFFLICILFIVFFTPKIRQSLWIDETITYWVVKDGLRNLVYRALHYQGQSPFYYFIVWCFIQILGKAEWVLRLPSILSLMIACFVLYRLCLILFDREWALFSIICFICLLQLPASDVGRDARPYGLAIMLSVLSVLCFIKWLKDSRVRYQLAYIIASTTTIYSHILFTPILFIHLCYYLMFKGDNLNISFKKLTLTFCIIVGSILPNVYQLILLFEKRKMYSFVLKLGIMDLITAWFPIKFFLLLIVGICISFIISFVIQRKCSIKIDRMCSKKFSFVLIWFFFPAFFLFIMSKINGSPIFTNRYICWSYPAIALVVSGLVKMLDNNASRWVAILIFPVVLILSNIVFYPTPTMEDWKNATSYINNSDITENRPILVRPGLIESRNEKWRNDPEKQGYLLAPFSYYTLQRKVILLPWLPNELKLETLLFNQHVKFSKGRNEICLVVRNYDLIFKGKKQKNISIQEVFDDWLRSEGFVPIERKSFGAIIVSRFY